jgi:hypothetical protein
LQVRSLRPWSSFMSAIMLQCYRHRKLGQGVRLSNYSLQVLQNANGLAFGTRIPVHYCKGHKWHLFRADGV